MMKWFNGLELAWQLCIVGVTLVIIPVASVSGISTGMFLLGVFLLVAGLVVALVDR